MIRSVAFAAAVSAAAPATAQDGTPILPQTVAATAEMPRIADAIDAAVDAKDWALARSLFADEITVDFTSLVGGEPATIPADALIAGWSGNLTEEKQSFQLRGNHRVVWDSPDHARMHSHGYAWNRMEAGALPENGGDPMWEVWGTYTHDFERESDGWVVTGMAFVMMAERGNLWVRNTPGE